MGEARAARKGLQLLYGRLDRPFRASHKEGGGIAVDLYDAMPSVGRKFLLAGVGGMNITHSEPFEPFVARYRERATALRPQLEAFTPEQLREWIHGLGIDTFVGTSGRVFPTDMKAAPLLRAWLRRLRDAGRSRRPTCVHRPRAFAFRAINSIDRHGARVRYAYVRCTHARTHIDIT